MKTTETRDCQFPGSLKDLTKQDQSLTEAIDTTMTDQTLLLLAHTEAPTTPAAPSVALLLTIFLLAIFIGFEIITKIPPTLHTPLMSGSNAISGITLVGALYCAGSDYPLLAKVLGVAAIAMATINVIGGFTVTDRMLKMFAVKKKS